MLTHKKGTVMKHNIIKRILSALLSLGMVASSASYALAADNVITKQEVPKLSAQSAVQTEQEASDKDSDLIELANSLANGTHTSYTSAYRDILNIKNQTMSLDYNLWAGSNNMNVNRLTNTKGASYIENTMDVFVKTDDGETYYSSKSTNSAAMNIYRYGYYYYENRIEGQVFIPEIQTLKSRSVNHLKPSNSNAIGNKSTSNNEYSYTITGSDPYVIYNNLDITASEYDYVEITVKATKAATSSQLFIMAGSATTYTAAQSYTFAMASNGDYHTYYIPLNAIEDYTGTLKGLRFDINGDVNSQVHIKSIKVIKSQDVRLDASLSIQRSFLSYSDKLHHLTQFSTTKEITGIECVGMETKIDTNTVNAIVVKDASGLKYSLDEVDWASAEYAGFDIAGAGIFGYILPADNKSGSMTITEKNGYYVITQTLAVSTFNPSGEKSGNSNDLFFGQRIYNDETHDFTTFLKEAECERNPLTKDNIIVDFSEDGAAFVGYDALRGYYRFSIDGTNFNAAYYDHPNRQYNIRFTVKGDEYDRQMYFMSRCSKSGCLESAVLLNDENMLLPIPMEVAKNFSGDGENTVYNINDAAYGETYFPVIANAGETRTYNLVNLYQNWGQFPLKQISSIQFHQPYYHLSTGVTETNCIVPYPVNSPALPDHRAMSAPFWTGQPQHNSGGGHSFLRYTDANGAGVSSQNTTAVIDSYGPTYCDITLGYESSDGKVSVTYTHTETPQIDENRAYYEIKYTFNEDVSFTNFRDNFTFYSVTDNNAIGVYQKLGYLNANNESVVADANHTTTSVTYTLGDNCPYFSFFMMPEWNRESTSAQGYTNLAMLFKDWKVTSNGEEISTKLCIRNHTETVYLSMDIDTISFKKGDTITINAILMPWGSQQMEDDPTNRLENAQTAIYNSPHYSDVLPDGTLYMDKNVRDVRENTLLDPLTASAGENSTVIDSPFVPRVKSTNGQSATFTVSGGYDNNVVRVYGFNKLTVPKIEQLVDGEWVEYVVSSHSTPDAYGYSHYYDGYMVHYDPDGTYSYSFVYNMTDVNSRTFRVSAEETFKGWPYSPSDVKGTPIDVFIDGKALYDSSSKAKEQFYSSKELLEDGSSVRLYINPTAGESYSEAHMGGTMPTGKYIVLKYRIPTTNSKHSSIEFWTSTDRTNAGGNDNITVASSAVRNDGQWHVMVLDVTQLKHSNCTFVQNEYGAYVPRYLRVDTTNATMAEGDYFDFAYIGFSDSIAEIVAANLDVETVDVINSNKSSYTSISTKNYTVAEDKAIKISFESADVNAHINTFTLDLKLENNTGFNFLRVIPQFDFDKFELVSVESRSLTTRMSQLNGSLIWVAEDTVTENGTLARFTFKAKEAAEAGEYDFGVKVVNAYSTTSTEVPTVTKAGVLNAWDSNYGDCNGDGSVTLSDVILLREYLVNYVEETDESTVEICKEADTNADGKINSADLTLLRQYFAYYDYAGKTPGISLGKQD